MSERLLLAVAKMLVAGCLNCRGSGFEWATYYPENSFGVPLQTDTPCPRCKELREAIRESEA